MKPEEKRDKPPITRAEAQTMLEIAMQRRALMLRLRQAILAGDTLLEHQIARELTGLPEETKQ
jgi:hypothetical protein